MSTPGSSGSKGMWGHPTACRCGVCLTLHRVCCHISDFSREPGYINFAAERLRVLAGELCDFIDARRRDTELRAASLRSGLLPQGERESQVAREGGHQGPGYKEEAALQPGEERSSKEHTTEVKREDEEGDHRGAGEESVDYSEKR